jgi:hypothetical protein
MKNNKQIGGSHYKEMGIQPTEYAYANDMRFLEANVVKYVSRHRFKGGAMDIKKAIHYLEMILEWEYNEPSVEDRVQQKAEECLTDKVTYRIL